MMCNLSHLSLIADIFCKKVRNVFQHLEKIGRFALIEYRQLCEARVRLKINSATQRGNRLFRAERNSSLKDSMLTYRMNAAPSAAEPQLLDPNLFAQL